MCFLLKKNFNYFLIKIFSFPYNTMKQSRSAAFYLLTILFFWYVSFIGNKFIQECCQIEGFFLIRISITISKILDTISLIIETTCQESMY